MLSGLAQDVRQAVRGWRRSPGFVAVALITMAAGIGSTTAIFSAVDAVLLRPLPYPEPDRLVAVHSTHAKRGLSAEAVSYPDVVDWRAQSRSFAALSAYRSSGAIIGGPQPEYVIAARVTPELFDVLGVPPALGGRFPAEAAQQPVRAVVLTHRLWQRRFGADPGVVGTSVVLNREPFTVAGVLPPAFQAPADIARAELFVPLSLDGENLRQRGSRMLSAIGRLRPEATRAQAAAELATVAQRLAAAHPDSNEAVGVSVRALHEFTVSDARAPLLVLMAAVACVLLIAGTNVAHLLLPRALARRREVAIRVALGASRTRVARELMVEVGLLWMLGATAGAAAASWAVSALVALAPPDTPRLAEIALDARVLTFAVVAALGTGLLFGVAPALTATRVAPGDALRQGGRSGALGRRRASGALVVAEMALALVLLVGAGLMVESLRRLVDEPPGFDPDGVLTAEISLAATRYDAPASREAFFSTLLERLRALPGVTAAAVVTPLPLSGDAVTSRVTIEGRPQPPSERPRVLYHAASPGYLGLMRIPLRRGRDIAESDRRGAPGAVVISETAAGRLFPGEDALGRHIELGVSVDDGDLTRFEVVGIAGDVHHRALRHAPEPEVYIPQAQHTWAWTTIVVRSTGPLEPLAGALRAEVTRIDPEQALIETRSMADRLSASVGVSRFVAVLLSLFAGVAVLLAAVGLYGVLATLVAQRTSEIGLRMAVGAEVRHVLRMIVGQAAWLAGIGIALGGLAALGLSRLMAALLFRIAPHDPATFAAVAGGLFLVALAAAARPAWRAAHIDPAIALRNE
jgi:putative ABC transport system permease protein